MKNSISDFFLNKHGKMVKKYIKRTNYNNKNIYTLRQNSL